MDIETKVKVWQLVVFLLALVSLCYDVVFLAMTNDPEWWGSYWHIIILIVNHMYKPQNIALETFC